MSGNKGGIMYQGLGIDLLVNRRAVAPLYIGIVVVGQHQHTTIITVNIVVNNVVLAINSLRLYITIGTYMYMAM